MTGKTATVIRDAMAAHANGVSQAYRGEKSRELHANTIGHRLFLSILVAISHSADQQHGNTANSGNQRR